MTTTTTTMMSLDEAIEFAKARRGAIDGRDHVRLGGFLPFDRLGDLGLTPAEHVTSDTWEHTEWTEENVLDQLRDDVEFGLEKAHDERGISAGCMHNCVTMWNGILRNGVTDTYGWYGLATFEATAERYGWEFDGGDE